MNIIAPCHWKYTHFEAVGNLCCYIPKSDDALSSKIISFKEGHAAVTQKWIQWASSEIESSGWGPFDYVIRSLGSNETVIPPKLNRVAKPLDLLGDALAKSMPGSHYVPRLIYKTRVTRKLAWLGSAAERRAELDGVYKLVDGDFDLSGQKILLIDDVTTAGTTFDAIAEVIKNACPAVRLFGFGLAQTDRNGTNTHIQHPFGNEYKHGDNYQTFAVSKGWKKNRL